MKLDEKDCLLGDRLLEKGSKLVLAGQPGVNKSRLVLQLAAASCSGKEWLGFPTFACDMIWLIMQTENSVRRLQMDLRILVKQYGRGFLKQVVIHTLENDMDGLVGLQGNYDRLARTMQRFNPDIFVVDPLRDFGIGDLNTDRDMSLTCLTMGQLVRQGNPQRALIVVQHALTGRAGAIKAVGYERIGFARSNKVLAGWTRAQINIAPGAPDNNDTLVIGCGKNSNGREFMPFAVRRNGAGIFESFPDFNLEAWMREVSTKSRSGSPYKHYSLAEAHGALPDFESWEYGHLVQEIMDKLRCGRTRATELVREGLAHGAWHQARRSKRYTKGASLGLD